MHNCRVCGFDGLEWPQYLENGEPNFVICDCCGFQSGYDDLDQGISIEEYRKIWINRGAQWVNEKLKPKNWDLIKHLNKINIEE
jgi:hypothetical protein